jgi:hypothetical protein
MAIAAKKETRVHKVNAAGRDQGFRGDRGERTSVTARPPAP